MPSVKKNLVWNVILTISGYLFPILTFPYVTRVLGAENLGIANFAMSIVDYAILFSTLGLASIGNRYIPQCNDNKDERNKVFSGLVSLHILLSLLILIIYTICVITIDQLREQYMLYIVGVTKIVMNIFLVEWLFQGMQDFRYITVRSIIIRFLYVIGIFACVRTSRDYDIYFYVTIATTVINAVINWRYTKRFVSFKFSLSFAKKYIYPVFSMGFNKILLSLYENLNVMVLGFACSAASVGYFTTATKLYSIFLSLLNAYNGVFVPHMNSLLGKGDIEGFKRIVKTSLSLVAIVSIPITIVGIILANEIIYLIAGSGFEKAVFPFQIILIQVSLVGFAQIFENQILLSLKKFKEVLICTSVSTLLSVLILAIFVPSHAEVGSAYAVAIPHVLECSLLYYYAKNILSIEFPFRDFIQNIIICIPIALICLWVHSFIDNYITILILSCTVSIVYYLPMQYYVIKNAYIRQMIDNIFAKIKRI